MPKIGRIITEKRKRCECAEILQIAFMRDKIISKVLHKSTTYSGLYASMAIKFLNHDFFMAIQSKYQDKQFEALLQELIIVLEKHKAPVDLSLMALGNTVTNILKSNVQSPQQREALAQAFSQALKNSLKS